MDVEELGRALIKSFNGRIQYFQGAIDGVEKLLGELKRMEMDHGHGRENSPPPDGDAGT